MMYSLAWLWFISCFLTTISALVGQVGSIWPLSIAAESWNWLLLANFIVLPIWLVLAIFGGSWQVFLGQLILAFIALSVVSAGGATHISAKTLSNLANKMSLQQVFNTHAPKELGYSSASQLVKSWGSEGLDPASTLWVQYANTQDFGSDGATGAISSVPGVFMFSETRQRLTNFEVKHPHLRLVAGATGESESLIYAHKNWPLIDSGVMPKAIGLWPQGVWACVLHPEFGRVLLVSIHTDSPAKAAREANRNAYFKELPDALDTLMGQCKTKYSVMMGDFNSDTFSPQWSTLTTRLAGVGFAEAFDKTHYATWPTPLAKWNMGWKIDHGWASGARRMRLSTLRPEASDHLRLLMAVEFGPKPDAVRDLLDPTEPSKK